MMRCFSAFWMWFHKKFGKENIGQIAIPAGFLGNFHWHYLLYDETGMVQDGARNMFSAIQKSRRTNLYISRIWD